MNCKDVYTCFYTCRRSLTTSVWWAWVASASCFCSSCIWSLFSCCDFSSASISLFPVVKTHTHNLQVRNVITLGLCMFKQKGCLLNTGLRYGKSTYGGRQVDNTSQITDLLLCCLHGYITEKSDKNDVSSPNGTQWLTDKTKVFDCRRSTEIRGSVSVYFKTVFSW